MRVLAESIQGPAFRRCRRAALLGLGLPAAVLLSLLINATGGSGASSAPPAACEPRMPLDISWETEGGGPSRPGSPVTLVLASRADLPAVRLDLLPPDALTQVVGPREFRGALARGEEERLTWRVAGGGPVDLRVRVTAVTSSGLVFRRGADIRLDGDGLPVPRHDPGRLIVAPDGRRKVREYPAVGRKEAR